MRPEHAAIVRETYAALAPRAGVLVDRFYARLFAARPEIRGLFQVNLAKQAQHLSAALALIVRNIDRLDMLEEPLRELGARHVAYGVLNDHYPDFREAMMGALRETAGPLWSAPAESAWGAALVAVTQAMLRGAAQVAFEAARAIAGDQPGTRLFRVAEPEKPKTVVVRLGEGTSGVSPLDETR